MEIQFCPPKDMPPGYYTVNIKFLSMELNDSGYIALEIPVILFHNPSEWNVPTKKPGIELYMFSTRLDTTNLIFGTGPNSTIRDDTLYGEDFYEWKLRDGDARFRYEKYQTNHLDFQDISPNDENRYSDSRDIKPIIDDTIPVIFHVVFEDSIKYYPITLQYESFNFDPTGTYLLQESLDANSKFTIDMRDVNILPNGRHQFVINDTSIKEYYIEYFKKLPSNVGDVNLISDGYIVQAYDQIILRNFKISDRIEIFDIHGRKIFESKFIEKVDVRNFPTGLYLIKIGSKICKFVK
jgi:hypothetical protein